MRRRHQSCRQLLRGGDAGSPVSWVGGGATPEGGDNVAIPAGCDDVATPVGCDDVAIPTGCDDVATPELEGDDAAPFILVGSGGDAGLDPND